MKHRFARLLTYMLTALTALVCASCVAGVSPALVGGLTGGLAAARKHAKARNAVAATQLPAPVVPTLPDSLSRLYDQFFLEAMVQRQKGNNDAAFDLLCHCLSINPYAAEAYYFLAQYYGGMKNTEKSLAYIRQAAALNPDNDTYMETLAQAYIRQQDFRSAITTVKRLYDRDKSRVDLLEMLFQLYQQVEDYPQAVATLEQLENADGKNEHISVAKSEIYSKMGNQKAAIAEMEQLAKSYPNDLNYLAMYGESLMMNGQTQAAMDIYDRVLREEPDNNRVLLSLRTHYLATGDRAAADSMTRRVLLNKGTGQDEKVYLLRQEVSSNEAAGGDSTQVLRLFRQIMAADTTDADMALLCATYMELKKMPADTIKPVLSRVLALAPDNASARLRLVSYAWADDDKDRVIELCQAARQYNPENMAFYYYQGIAFFQRDSLDQALSTFQNGVSVIDDDSNPEIVADFYEVMGEILHRKGRTEEAFAAYDSCLQWKPDNLSCLNNYAYYLSLRNEQLERAEQMSYKTIKEEPQNATYLDTYAWILFVQQRYSEARIYIDQAMQHMETVSESGDTISNADIYNHAGDIYWFCEEPDTAMAYWRNALKGDAGNKVLIRKIKLKKYIKE